MSDDLPCVFCAGDPTEGLVVLFDGIRERPVCKRCLDDKLHLDARVFPKLKRPGIWILMCRNCKHWDNTDCPGPDHQYTKVWGYCLRTGDDAKGDVPMYVEVDPDPYPSYWPQVKTYQDFGCVMFEAKGGE